MHSIFPHSFPSNAIRRPARVPRRRGKAAVVVLAVLAALAFLIAIGGAFAVFKSGTGAAVGALMRQMEGIASNAQEFDCPGSLEIEAAKGGAIFVLVPDAQGRVADPKQGTAFTLTVAGPDGGALEVDMNKGQSLGDGTPEVLAFVTFPEDGTYTVTAAAADGATTARVAVLPGTLEDFDALEAFAGSATVGFMGACAGACGLLLALGFGIAAIVVGLRKPQHAEQRDPLAL